MQLFELTRSTNAHVWSLGRGHYVLRRPQIRVLVVPSPHLLHDVDVAHHVMRAHDELGFGVPLVVSDVEAGLQPDPLLAFGQKPVVTGGALALLHHCKRSQAASI